MQIPTETACLIVDGFLPSQEETPLSSGSGVLTATEFIESGIDLWVIARVDLDDDPNLLEYAVRRTLDTHEAVGATGFTTEKAVRRRLPEAYRINAAVALRIAVSAATGEEFEPLVTKVNPKDERVKRAQTVLATPHGRERALGILTTITERLYTEDSPDTPSLQADYRAAQLGQTSPRFPENDTSLPNRELRRRQLMQHMSTRLAGLAIESPDTAPVIKTLLQDEPDPVSLRLRPIGGTK